MKAIHKLKSERDYQCQGEHEIRSVAGGRGGGEIPCNMEDDVEKAAGQRQQKHGNASGAG